jgi:hypothetical protein
MYYRVVMQGRTVGGADTAAVKREFVRVTGLPVRVADELFGGMPSVIKRKVAQSDAERIAATLRAIGAVATVEREAAGTDEDETDEGINIIASPLASGPPTIAPGAGGAAPETRRRRPKWLESLVDRWQTVLATVAAVGLAVTFAPEAAELFSSLRPAPAPPPKVAVAAAPQPATAPEVVSLNASLLHGPWRCVNQRTGLGVYWSYGADGALVFHGDVLSDRPAARADDRAMTSWRIDGGRLVHANGKEEIEAFKVAQLTLSRLKYAAEKGPEVECRRP